MPTPPRPKFIAGQRISELVCTPGTEEQFLSDERFRPFEDTRGDIPSAGQPRGWRPVANRERFLIESREKYPRLILTIEGGIGKTTALDQLAYLHSATDPGHLCLVLEVADLPTSAAAILGSRPPTPLEDRDRPPLLIERFRRFPETRDLDGTAVWNLLQRKIRTRQCSLLIDALDQVDLEENPKPTQMVKALATLLQQYPDLNCVVTGRPYAVGHYWRALTHGTGSWKLAAIGPFTEDEQKEFLGDKFAAIQQLEAQVLGNPRALKRLLDMSPEELAGLRTAADVYWVSLEKILRDGCSKQTVRMSEDQAIGLYALLAIEMTQRGKFVRVPSGREFETFCHSVFTRRTQWLAGHGVTDPSALVDLLGRLDKLNIVIDHAVSDTRGVTSFRWQDRTLQDMFSAVWLTRHADPEDRLWLADRRLRAGHEQEENTAGLWRLVCGMPVEPRVCDPLTYVQAIAIVYQRFEAIAESSEIPVSPPSRPTELIWRSWPTLLQIAGLCGSRGDQSAVQAVTTQLRRDVYGRVRDGHLRYDPQAPVPATAREAALHVIEQFLAEFPAIRFGQYTPADCPRAELIAREFDTEWFPTEIPPGAFLMGSPQREAEPEHMGLIQTAFQPAKYPVTNELYRLFDAGHFGRFAEYAKYSGNDRAPVIHIDWYDAWCGALWMHGRLLNEYEWERACRGTQGVTKRTDWCLPDDDSELERYAWYATNSGGHAHAVDESGENAKLPNDLGIYHMHGNVWEWTSSWYSQDPRGALSPAFVGSSRVLRGGSWDCNADLCRSACRSRFSPVNCLLYHGFRLSRS